MFRLWLPVVVVLLILTGTGAAEEKLTKEGIPADMPAKVRAEVEKLFSEDAAVRGQALHKLWGMHGSAAPAAAYLVMMLEDEADLPQKLQRFGNRSCADYAERTLKDIGKRALDPLLALAGHEKPTVRRRVIGLIAGIRDPKAVDALLEATKDSDVGVQTAAMGGLASCRDPRAVPVLKRLLETGNAEAKKQALAGLASMGDPALADVIAAALGDGDKGVRVSALIALSNLGAPGSEKHAMPFVKDPDKSIRACAVGVVGRLAAKENVALLTAALADPAPDVRLPAIFAIGGLGTPEALNALLGTRADEPVVRVALLRQMANFDDPGAVKLLVAALTDADKGIRAVAIKGLGSGRATRIEDTAAIDPLIEASKKGSSFVKQDAIRALAKIPDDRAFKAVLAALKDKSSHLRAAAIRALAKREDEAAVDAILGMVTDKDRETRRAAIAALARRSHPKVCEALLTAMKDQDRWVRSEALRALGAQGDPRACDAIIAALEDKDLRSTAILALAGQSSDKALDALAGLAKSDDGMVRSHAISALAGMENKKASDVLLGLMGNADVNVRAKAISALGERKERRAVAPLIALLGDAQLAPMAAHALSQVSGKDFGKDAAKWKEWWEKEGKGGRGSEPPPAEPAPAEPPRAEPPPAEPPKPDPAAPSIPAGPEINVLAAANGAVVLFATSQYNTHNWGARNLIDGSAEAGHQYASQKNEPQEIVFELAAPARVRSVHLDASSSEGKNTWARNFELLGSAESPYHGFSALCSGELANEPGNQAFTFEPRVVRWVLLRVLSNRGGGYIEMSEIGLTGVLGPAPARAGGANVLAAATGAKVVSFTSQHSTSWAASNIIDGATGSGHGFCASGSDPVEIVIELGKECTIDRIGLCPDTNEPPANWAREVEVLFSIEGPDCGFRAVGKWELSNEKPIDPKRTRPTDFRAIDPAKARFVKLRILSNHGGGYLQFGELMGFAAGK